MSLAERIKAVRMSQSDGGKKLSQTLFGERLGLAREVVTSYEIGRVVPPEPTIRLMCQTFGVDYDWLKNGVGEMYESQEAATLAELDDLMAGEEHPETKALIAALAGMSNAELDVVDALIARIKKELGG